MQLTSKSLHALLFSLTATGLFACGTPSTSPGTSSSALSTGSDSSDGGAAEVTSCLATFAECVRGGSDEKTCGDALRTCLPRPGGAGDCDHGGPPPNADGGTPPPPPNSDGAAAPPPPPRDGHPPDGDGDGPPAGDRPAPPDGDAPPPPDADGGPHDGPRACIDALATCAKGTDAIDTCVATADACLAALPPPPPPRDHGEGR